MYIHALYTYTTLSIHYGFNVLYNEFWINTSCVSAYIHTYIHAPHMFYVYGIKYIVRVREKGNHACSLYRSTFYIQHSMYVETKGSSLSSRLRLDMILLWVQLCVYDILIPKKIPAVLLLLYIYMYVYIHIHVYVYMDECTLYMYFVLARCSGVVWCEVWPDFSTIQSLKRLYVNIFSHYMYRISVYIYIYIYICI